MVDFIVRAVDDVLKTEFGLADGLADTSKVTVDWDTGQDDTKTGKPRTIKKEVHKVQILDPATGTGTFLAKAVQLISDRVKARAPGKWSSYVEEDLLPRLHGFERRFGDVDARFDAVDARFDKVDAKLADHDHQLGLVMRLVIRVGNLDLGAFTRCPLRQRTQMLLLAMPGYALAHLCPCARR